MNVLNVEKRYIIQIVDFFFVQNVEKKKKVKSHNGD